MSNPDDRASKNNPSAQPSAEEGVAQLSFRDLQLTDDEVSVVLQGLIALVETTDSGQPSIEALVPNTSQRPEVLTGQNLQPHLPQHLLFIALEDMVLVSDGQPAQPSAQAKDFLLPWMGSAFKLDAFPLCDVLACNGTVGMEVNVGFDVRPAELAVKPDLQHLVQRDSFIANALGDYFKLRDNPETRLLARISFANATKIEAAILPSRRNTDQVAEFGFRELKGGREETPCRAPDSGAKPFAEETRVVGKGPITISIGGRSRVFAKSGPMPRLWIFNVHPLSYERPDESHPHPEAFYWYYNLAPGPCRREGGKGIHLMPCEPTLGDPKCPQALLLGGG